MGWPLGLRHALDDLGSELHALLADGYVRSEHQPNAEVLALTAEGALGLVHGRTLDPELDTGTYRARLGTRCAAWHHLRVDAGLGRLDDRVGGWIARHQSWRTAAAVLATEAAVAVVVGVAAGVGWWLVPLLWLGNLPLFVIFAPVRPGRLSRLDDRVLGPTRRRSTREG